MEQAVNIAELTARMKTAVDQFEHTRSPNLLDNIERDFLQFAHLVTLFLISERDTYYGYFFMSMTFRANFECNSIAGIRLDSYPPVFETNPLILMKYSLKEILYIFCHEVDHVVFNHPAEMVKSNPEKQPELFELFNYAADASVNDLLNWEAKRSKKFLKAPSGVITSDVLARRFNLANIRRGESYRYYFDLIKENVGNGDKANHQNGHQKGASDQNGNNKGRNVGTSNGIAPIPTNGESEDRIPKSKTHDSRAQAAVTAAQASGNIIDHAWISDSDELISDAGEMLTEAVKDLVNEANTLMGDEARSMMPAYFVSQVNRLNQPAKLNWKAILKRYVGTIAAEKTKTRTRLNRRQPRRFDLSGAMESKKLKIVVAIDASCSMSDADIEKIFNEIFAIIARRKFELTVIECDTEIQRVYTLKKPSDAPRGVRGRGGTAFSPVIKYVNDRRYFRDALLIYFTDGFGEREIPRPLTYRNLWVVLDDTDNLSIKKPYGIVLPLED